jgi:cell wall-associated NlpC family hydrolase
VFEREVPLIRSYGTAVAVFALLGSLMAGVAEASVELAADRAENATISPAYASPAFVASLESGPRDADAPSLGPVALSLPASSVLTEEARMWGMPGINAVAPLKHITRKVASQAETVAEGLTHSAMRFIGTPFVFGGTSIYGFDCSGYVQHVFAMLGMHIPRTADAQYDAARSIRGHMTQGDLVFFQTYAPGVSHVGIYLGEGRFIHASSHGVRISRLSERYWSSRYLGAKRVIAGDLIAKSQIAKN